MPDSKQRRVLITNNAISVEVAKVLVAQLNWNCSNTEYKLSFITTP